MLRMPTTCACVVHMHGRAVRVPRNLMRILNILKLVSSVPYSQGLNEIVAPLFFIGESRDVKFQLFYALVQRFFPLLFRGDNMRRQLDPLMHCLRMLLQ